MVEKLKNLSLKIKFRNLFIIVTVVMLVFSIFLVQHMWEILKNTEKETFIEQVMVYDKIFTDLITSKYENLQVIDGKLISEDGTEILKQTELVDHLKELSNVDFTIFVVREDGHFYREMTTLLQTGTNEREIGTMLSNVYIEESLKGGKDYTGEATIFNKKYLGYYSPVYDSSGDIIAATFSGLPTDRVNEKIMYSTRKLCLLICVSNTFIFLAIFLSILGIRDPLFKALKKPLALSKRIASYDLSKNIEITKESKDEIEALATGLSTAQDSLRDIIKNIQACSEVSHSSIKGLQGDIDRATDASIGIAQTISSVAEDSSEQSNLAFKMSDDLNKFTNILNKTDEGTETLNRQSQQIHEDMETNKKTLALLEDQTVKCSKAVEEIAIKINNISKSSANLQEFVNSINAISSQTNLLALNASIEAARSGEAGRGFAVIAKEVQQLSAQTSDFTKEATALISSLTEDISLLKKSSDMVEEASVLQKTSINDTSNKFENITHSLGEINVTIESLVANSNELNKSKENLISLTSKVLEMSQNNAAATEEISACSQEQAATYQHITASVKMLEAQVDSLCKTVDQFKI